MTDKPMTDSKNLIDFDLNPLTDDEREIVSQYQCGKKMGVFEFKEVWGHGGDYKLIKLYDDETYGGGMEINRFKKAISVLKDSENGG